MPVRLSFSKISTYIECPRKYFLSYIVKLGTGSSPHMSNGSAIHKCCEDFEDFGTDKYSEFLGSKFSENSETSEKGLKNLILYYYKILPQIDKENLVHQLIEGELIVNPLFEEKAKKAFKSFYEDYTENFYEQEREGIEPIIKMQEGRFALELKDGNTISGIIDRIDKEPSGEHIVDYKSGQTRITFKALKDPLADKSLQLSIYALARYKETGKVPHRASFFYLEPLKNNKKQEGQYRTASEFTEKTLNKVEDFLNDIAIEIDHAIKDQRFPMGDNPNCFWCDFNKKCEILAEREINELNNSLKLVKDTEVKEVDNSLWTEE